MCIDSGQYTVMYYTIVSINIGANMNNAYLLLCC